MVSNQTSWHMSLAYGSERRQLRELLADGGFDLIHFHTIVTPFLSYQIFARFLGAKVATFHDVPPASRTGAALRGAYSIVDRFVFPRLEAVILASEVQKNYHAVERAVSCSTIPPCISIDRFGTEHEPFQRWRDGRVNILFLNRLDERKGVLLMLQAYRELRAAGIDGVRLLVAGDGPERRAAEHYVAQHAVPDVVFAGRVHDAEVPRWFATADIMCAPSIDGEGFGIVLVEAMASGKPVVAAANSGYRLVLTGEGAAGLTPPGDVHALAQRLRQFVNDRDLRQRLSGWGRRAAAQFDCRRFVDSFVNIYETAIERAARRASKPQVADSWAAS
jgi:phosphatidylinositol alpha-mannosyltransferase